MNNQNLSLRELAHPEMIKKPSEEEKKEEKEEENQSSQRSKNSSITQPIVEEAELEADINTKMKTAKLTDEGHITAEEPPSADENKIEPEETALKKWPTRNATMIANMSMPTQNHSSIIEEEDELVFSSEFDGSKQETSLMCSELDGDGDSSVSNSTKQIVVTKRKAICIVSK